MLEVIRLPAFKDNYIWLLRKAAQAVVVDPGDARPVLAALEAGSLSLAAILLTHHHGDHQGGVGELLARHPGAVVYGPAAESITGVTQPLAGGESFLLDALGCRFEVMAVPGHTAGHLAYLAEGRLFCGDTLFAGGCGRVFEGTMRQMHESLSRLSALPDDTLVYCAHEYTEANLRFALAVEPGNGALQARVREVAALRARGEASVPSTLGDEKASNPFLRCARPEVVAAARRQAGAALPTDDPAAVFAVLREWKNAF